MICIEKNRLFLKNEHFKILQLFCFARQDKIDLIINKLFLNEIQLLKSTTVIQEQYRKIQSVSQPKNKNQVDALQKIRKKGSINVFHKTLLFR